MSFFFLLLFKITIPKIGDWNIPALSLASLSFILKLLGVETKTKIIALSFEKMRST
jgi:hypothetical protein